MEAECDVVDKIARRAGRVAVFVTDCFVCPFLVDNFYLVNLGQLTRFSPRYST